MAFWRDLSVIWLSLFCFIGLLIPIAVLYFAVRGMQALHHKVQPLFPKAQGISGMVRTQTSRMSQRVAEPVIQAHASYAKTKTRLQTLWPHNK